MNERRLTTAELIEQLKIGEKARMDYPYKVVVKREKEYGILIEIDDSGRWGAGNYLPISNSTMRATWILGAKEISFKDAVEHIKAGREVICHHEDRKVTYNSLNDLIYIWEVLDGKWYLSENNSSLD